MLRAESRVILETVGSTERRETIQDTRPQSTAVGQPARQDEAIVETGETEASVPSTAWCNHTNVKGARGAVFNQYGKNKSQKTLPSLVTPVGEKNWG